MEYCVSRISAIDEMDMVSLLVPLLSLSEAQRQRLFQEALTINLDLTLTGTTRIGYDGGGLVLCHALPVETLDGARAGRPRLTGPDLLAVQKAARRASISAINASWAFAAASE